MRRLRAREEETLKTGTDEEKQRVIEKKEKAQLSRSRRQRKTMDISMKSIKPSTDKKKDTSVARVNTRSSS